MLISCWIYNKSSCVENHNQMLQETNSHVLMSLHHYVKFSDSNTVKQKLLLKARQHPRVIQPRSQSHKMIFLYFFPISSTFLFVEEYVVHFQEAWTVFIRDWWYWGSYEDVIKPFDLMPEMAGTFPVS